MAASGFRTKPKAAPKAKSQKKAGAAFRGPKKKLGRKVKAAAKAKAKATTPWKPSVATARTTGKTGGYVGALRRKNRTKGQD